MKIDPNEVQRLLDAGYEVRLYPNQLGSYTAVSLDNGYEVELTDDFTPNRALHRLTKKQLDDETVRRDDYED